MGAAEKLREELVMSYLDFPWHVYVDKLVTLGFNHKYPTPKQCWNFRTLYGGLGTEYEKGYRAGPPEPEFLNF